MINLIQFLSDFAEILRCRILFIYLFIYLFIIFFFEWILFEGGFYSRAASIYRILSKNSALSNSSFSFSL